MSLEDKELITGLKAKVSLISPFYSYILNKLPIEISDATKEETGAWAWFDGNKAILLRETIQSSQFAIFSILHEITHHLFMHIDRLKSYPNKQAFQMGSDVIVNGYLEETIIRQNKLNSTFTTNILTLNSLISEYHIIYKPQWKDKTAEEWAEEYNGEKSLCGLIFTKNYAEEDSVDTPSFNWRDLILEAQVFANKYGNRTRDHSSIIESMLYPPTPLHKYLFRYIKQKQPSRYTLSKPNKSYLQYDILMPTLKFSSSKIYVALDVSGSISNQQLSYFFWCLKSIRKRCPELPIQVLENDTEIKEDIPLEEFLKTPQRKGIGGTDFRSIFKYLQPKHPSLVIFMTDGMGKYGNRPSFPVIWALTHNHTDPPWGTKTVLLDNTDFN